MSNVDKSIKLNFSFIKGDMIGLFCCALVFAVCFAVPALLPLLVVVVISFLVLLIRIYIKIFTDKRWKKMISGIGLDELRGYVQEEFKLNRLIILLEVKT